MRNQILCLASLLVFLVIGCGSKTVKQAASIPQFGQLKNIKDAPEALKNAAKAIVRFQNGTAFFISKDGLLMTNNHVLGTDSCSKDGCFVNLVYNYQIGNQPNYATSYATPVFVAPDLDVAVFQLRKVADNPAKQAKAEKVSSPNYLKFSRVKQFELIGSETYVIGHPKGAVKKWSKGTAYNNTTTWFRTSNMHLPGNSGSPFLDKEGKVVGILHRGPDSHGDISKKGLNHYSIGTSSEAILERIDPQGFRVVGDDNLGRFQDVSADIAPEPSSSTEDYVRYLNSRVVKVKTPTDVETGLTAEIKETAIVELMGKDCDIDFAKEPSSYDDMLNTYAKCDSAMKWISCDSKLLNAKNTPLYCPDADEQKIWRTRFAYIAERTEQFNLPNYYYWLTSAPADFATDQEERLAVGSKGLKRYLEQKKPRLDFILAFHLIKHFAKNDKKLMYHGKDVNEFVRNFRDTPGYEHYLVWIADAVSWMWMYEQDRADLLNTIVHDSKISLEDRLYVETLLYRGNYFSLQF